MTTELPERLNIADRFLDAHVREGRGARRALITDAGTFTYAQVQERANRFAHALARAGVVAEQRVMIALPDQLDFVAALFGTLKLGAVVVMVNPALAAGDLRTLLEYSRARAVVTHGDAAAVRAAAIEAGASLLVVDESGMERDLAATPATFATLDTHRDDPAIWLFSGGTTGRPKAVVQTHRAFAYTTACYGLGVLGLGPDDITLSVPKLYFGYATGSNLLFPFAAGATSILFADPATPERLFDLVRRHRPTVLINVPTMIHKMTAHREAATQDLSSLRMCTSAGEALPVELDERWRRAFGVELLDGLGTAEMWHIFVSNRPGAARPGTLGTVVPGFEVRVCDDEGRPLPAGETGWLWVRGGARALGYWQNLDRTMAAFRGEWYVSGDLIAMDADGYVTYCGRGDELLKVAGKWLAPADVEGCLLQHPAVAEAAVVGLPDPQGLIKPVAFVVARGAGAGLAEELQGFVRERLEPYKHPRAVVFLDALPRTHLGKVDRGALRRPGAPGAVEPSSVPR